MYNIEDRIHEAIHEYIEASVDYDDDIRIDPFVMEIFNQVKNRGHQLLLIKLYLEDGREACYINDEDYWIVEVIGASQYRATIIVRPVTQVDDTRTFKIH